MERSRPEGPGDTLCGRPRDAALLVPNTRLSRAGSPSGEDKGRQRFAEAKEVDECGTRAVGHGHRTHGGLGLSSTLLPSYPLNSGSQKEGAQEAAGAGGPSGPRAGGRGVHRPGGAGTSVLPGDPGPTLLLKTAGVPWRVWKGHLFQGIVGTSIFISWLLYFYLFAPAFELLTRCVLFDNKIQYACLRT